MFKLLAVSFCALRRLGILFPRFTQCVTSNPFWYFYFCFDLWCCSHFKGHAPLTRCMIYFLAEFHIAMKLSQVCKWCISSDGRTQQILCCLLILNFCCKFPHCIIRPAGQGIFPGPAGFSPALLSGILPRLWGSEVPTVSASSRHVAPWNVVAESNPPLGLDALIRATASQCLLLDVPV
jgi:hypothetical protein